MTIWRRPSAPTTSLRYFPSFGAKEQLHPTTYILNRLQREAAGRIRLGLDLQGGTSFLVEMDTNGLAHASDADTALSHAVEVLRKRVDKFGVAEPLIQPEGNNRILVQLPGLSAADQESAKIAIQKAAFLEFRLVSPTSDQDVKDGIVQPGYEILKRKERMRNGRERTEEVEVKKRAEMDGSGIKSAMVVRGNLGEPEIHFTLDSEGAERFAKSPAIMSISAWPSSSTASFIPRRSSKRPSKPAAARSPASSTTRRPSSWPMFWRTPSGRR